MRLADDTWDRVLGVGCWNCTDICSIDARRKNTIFDVDALPSGYFADKILSELHELLPFFPLLLFFFGPDVAGKLSDC